jgi:hypothetical protein
MRNLMSVALGLVVLVTPASLGAWAMDVHKDLTRRAVEGLPPDLRPFFMAQVDFISEHAADPDLWRIVGLRGDLGSEDSNHYLDIDALDEPAPFANVPHEWDAFVKRYGADRANRAGRLPWRAQEVYTRLVTAFQDIGKGASPYAAENARYLSSVLSHYIEDAHVPFHATGNHDGDLTNQHGVHARFETELTARNSTTLKLAPVSITPMSNMREFIFQTVIDSQALVASVLDADRRAAGGGRVYDDAYFATFFTGARAVLEQRMSQASSAVASAIVSAWEQGGKPTLPARGTMAAGGPR